jgi:hypothetical protein
LVPDRTGHFSVRVVDGDGVDGRAVGDEVRSLGYEVRGAGGASASEFQVGQHVTVIYDPQHPESALIDTGKGLWLGPLVLIVMGTVFGLGGAWPLLRLLRRVRRAPTHTRKSNVRPRRSAPARRQR